MTPRPPLLHIRFAERHGPVASPFNCYCGEFHFSEHAIGAVDLATRVIALVEERRGSSSVYELTDADVPDGIDPKCFSAWRLYALTYWEEAFWSLGGSHDPKV